MNHRTSRVRRAAMHLAATMRFASRHLGLAPRQAHAYTPVAAETTADRFSSRIRRGRTAAPARFFYVRTPCATFYGRALAGERSRSPVSYVAGLLTLPCARPPRLAAGSRVLNLTQERP